MVRKAGSGVEGEDRTGGGEGEVEKEMKRRAEVKEENITSVY